MRSLVVALISISISILSGTFASRDTLNVITSDRAKVEQFYRDSLSSPRWFVDNTAMNTSCQDVYMAHNPRNLNETTPLDSIEKDITCRITNLGYRFIKFTEGRQHQGFEHVLLCTCFPQVTTRPNKIIDTSLVDTFYIMRAVKNESYFELVKIGELDRYERDKFRPTVYYVYKGWC